MQLITLASAAATLFATASATSAASAFNLNASCIETEPKARVYNRCSYPVHLWSVVKGQGCPTEDGAVLHPGEFYQENYRPAVDNTGTSIKIAKDSQCKTSELLQLEYFIETENPGYNYNYLDVSYVDCGGKQCPTASEGFYLKSGNQDGKFLANILNEICPILSCGSFEECAKVAYILPDDRQTKSCSPEADLEFYMCGSEAPGLEIFNLPSSSETPSSTVKTPKATSTPTPTPTPTSTTEAAAYTPEVAAYTPEAAAYTPEVATPAEITPTPKVPNVKTEVVYVTQYEYVNAKRHVHGHRHQPFRA